MTAPLLPVAVAVVVPVTGELDGRGALTVSGAALTVRLEGVEKVTGTVVLPTAPVELSCTWTVNTFVAVWPLPVRVALKVGDAVPWPAVMLMPEAAFGVQM